MKTRNDQLQRQLCIINKLRSAKGPVPADTILDYIERERQIYDFAFPENLKSRMRLLQRDIRAIDSIFYISIAHKRGQGYYIKDWDEDSPMDYERFIFDFHLLCSISPESNVHKYVIPERNRYIGSDNFHALLTAIKEHRKVEFSHKNIRKNCIKKHKVTPYFLKEDQMRWYLICIDENKKNLSFAIERIFNLTISDETYIRDETIDGAELFKDCFGIYDDNSPVETVILKYDHLDGAFLKSVPLHPSQQILADNENEFRISLKIKISPDFVMELLSRSRSLEVIAPKSLRDKIRNIYEEALTRNNSD